MGFAPSNDSDQLESLDLKAIFRHYLSFWPVILLGAIIGAGGAYTLNLYKQNVYNLDTVIEIKSNNNSFLLDDPIPFFGQNDDQVESQSAILRSYRHNMKVAKALNWEVSYFRKGLFVDQEVYKNSPYTIVFDQKHPQAINLPVYLIAKENGFSLSIDLEENELVPIYTYESMTRGSMVYKDSFEESYAFNQWVTTPFFRFKVQLKDGFSGFTGTSEPEEFFIFRDYTFIAAQNRNSVQIGPIEARSTIVRVSASGQSKSKLVDYLNASIQALQLDELDKKNLAINNTIDFIDDQLQSIVDSLLTAEQDLQDFRSENRVVDLNDEANQTFSQFIELERSRSALELQRHYYDYVEKYITTNEDLSALAVPSASSMADLGVADIAKQLVSLSLQKTGMSLSMTEKNPAIRALNEQIKELRSNLLRSVANLKSTNELQLKDIGQRIDKIEGTFAELPATEQTLINLRRRYELNNNLYTLLLEKRADAGIARSANSYDTEIIDPAIDLGQGPIAPKRKMTLMLGFFAGIVIPIGLIFIRDYINDSITDADAIKKQVNLPILGEIIHNKTSGDLIPFDNAKLVVAEGFRTLRTNLQFAASASQAKTKVIMVASSVSGEGKTFITNNLGAILAASKKSTLIISADLRKNSTAMAFELKSDLGLTNYLINQNDIDSIIQKTQNPFLSVITAGPIPPNPSELITSDEFESLINTLVAREQFDYIIIDTPPVILFSDAQYISKLVDFTLFVLRQRYTKTKMLDLLKDKQKLGFLKNIFLVANDIKPLKSAAAYGYGKAYSSYSSYGYDKKRTR